MLFHERIEQMVPPPSCVGDFYEVTKKPRSLSIAGFDSVPFVPMDAVPQGGAFDPAYTPKAGSAISSGTYFEAGDLLIAKITPSFENGKQAFAKELPAKFGYATTEVIPLRPKTADQDRRFLFYYLLHPDIRAFVAEKMEGATGRQRVPENVLLDLPFPSFSKVDQAAIGDVLETVRRAIGTEERLGHRHAELKRAAMRDLFTRGLRAEAQKETEIGIIPESWDVVPMGSLGRIGNGSTPKKSIAEYWAHGTYPWLTSGKMYDRNIEQADKFVTERALAECHLPKLQPGAVLIAITGQGKTLGHCAVLKIEATINQHVAYLATDQSRAVPSFLRGYLETKYDYFRQVGAGGGSTKGALTCAFLRSLAIPLPTALDEQREIADILDAIDAKIELHQRKQALLEVLFRALLHKLMTGEIRVSDLDLSALDTEADA